MAPSTAPGTSIAPGGEQFELVRRRKFPLVGDGGGVWSFIHVADAAEAGRDHRRPLARRFFAAAEQGDLAGLEALLAHDVELTGDGGGKVPALARSLGGRDRVARTLINWVRLGARLPGVSVRPVEINGGPGALFLDAQRQLIAVWALDIAGGQITSISSIVNPDKLTHLGPVGDFASLMRSAR
jgi:hypothetical protein